MKKIVRIERIRITNANNVECGEIYTSNQKELSKGDNSCELSHILGLYGQNGTGKTTFINCLRIIQTLVGGNGLLASYSNMINVDSNSMGLEVDFYINVGKKEYYVTYAVVIGRNSNSKLQINEENLSYCVYNSSFKKNNIYSFKFPNTLNEKFKRGLKKESKIFEYIVGYECSTKLPTGLIKSTIFNENLFKLVRNAKNENFAEYCEIVVALADFAQNNLAIYNISYFGGNESFGIKFRVKSKSKEVPLTTDIMVSFGRNRFDKKSYEIFSKTIEDINKVLPSIIHDYKIVPVIMNSEEDQKITGDKEVMLYSEKKGKKLIPLSFESNGIKKIISILSGLIDSFNHEGSFMAIDELDSGIFEYLLGEIIYAFDNFGKGQLLFTSHNLRVLEKISYKKVFFSTTNPLNRFTLLGAIHETNNLRDVYYKYISRGYKNDVELYDLVKTEDIVNSLYLPEE